MADNPFYPGYVPNDKRYPGSRPIRRPFNPPQQYDFDQVSNYITSYFDELEGALSMPVQEYKEDLAAAWRRTAVASKASKTVADEYAEDIDETAGVSVTMNLNPVDWTRNPSEQTGDFVKGLVRSTTGIDIKGIEKDRSKGKTGVMDLAARVNLSDLMTHVERREIWEPLVGKQNGTPHTFDDIWGQQFLKSATKRSSLNKDSPLALYGLGIEDTAKDGGSVEKAFKIVSVVNNPDGSITAKTEDVSKGKDVYKGTASTFLDFIDDYKSSGDRNSAARKFQKSALNAIAVESESSAEKELFTKYRSLNEVAKTMSGGPPAYTPVQYWKIDDAKLAEEAQSRSIGQLMDHLNYNLAGANLRGVGEKKEQLVQNSNKIIKMLHDESTGTGYIEYVKGKIENARNALPAGSKDRLQFDSMAREYTDLLDNLKAEISNIDTSKNLAHSVAKIQKLQDKLSNKRFGGGIEDKFLNITHDNISYDKNISKHLEGGRRLQVYSRIARYKYDQEAVNDLAGIIEGGPAKLIDMFVVPRARLYVQKILPKTIIGKKILTPTHAFGFAYDEYANTYGIAKKITPKNIFNVRIDGKNVAVNGGEHFKGAVNLDKLMKAGKLTDAQLIALMNGNYAALAGASISYENFGKFEKEMKSLRAWLLANETKPSKVGLLARLRNKQLGLQISGDKIEDNAANVSKLKQLLDQVGRRNNTPGMVNASWEYAGHLQKLAEKLSILQNKIFKSKIVKLFRPYVMFKETFAAGLANTVFAGITSATGGAGALLLPLKRLFQLAIKKTLDTIESLTKGLLKGDLSEFFKGLEGAFLNVAKTLMVIVFVPIGLAMFLVILLYGILFTTISPVDPTREVIPSLIGGIYGRSGYTGTGDEFINAELVPALTIGECPNGEPFITFADADGAIPWSSAAAHRDFFEQAALALSGNSAFVEQVCNCGGVEIIRSDDVNGLCGQRISGGTIVFYDTCHYDNYTRINYLIYLMAHEIGHHLWWCSEIGASNLVANARQCQQNLGRETSQGTYIPNGCSLDIAVTTSPEEFADMVGNSFVINVWDCANVATNFCGVRSNCNGASFWDYYSCYRDLINGLIW